MLRFIRNLKKKTRKKKIKNKNKLLNNNKEEDVQHDDEEDEQQDDEEDVQWLTGREYTNAKLVWIKDVQTSLNLDTSKRKQLRLFTDENGLWRCEGRLDKADIPNDSKQPILLPKNQKFSELVVIKAHNEVKHRGLKETLNEIRKEFWISQPRNFIKRIISDCSSCRYYEGAPYAYPDSGPLPRERVSKENAFTNIGIDYAGPVYVKNIYDSDGSTYKAWIAIVTCASSQAMYLDLVTDCSGPACVNLLKRFTSIFGCPKVVISDNGKNFISNDVQNFMSSKGTYWKFNVECAPWTGGFFERMVKMVKRCLRKVLRKKKLNFDEFVTVLKEIQNILNHRPLTYLYTENLNDTLTPNKLLFGRNISNEVTHERVETTEPQDQLKHIRTLTDHFWNVWRDEYLLELREHDKRKKVRGNAHPTKRDVVLIKDERIKRSEWRIGHVNKLIYSQDGRIRAAKVNVVTGDRFTKLKRPINKLFPIEFQPKVDTNENRNEITFVSDNDTITFLSFGECVDFD